MLTEPNNKMLFIEYLCLYFNLAGGGIIDDIDDSGAESLFPLLMPA